MRKNLRKQSLAGKGAAPWSANVFIEHVKAKCAGAVAQHIVTLPTAAREKPKWDLDNCWG